MIYNMLKFQRHAVSLFKSVREGPLNATYLTANRLTKMFPPRKIIVVVIAVILSCPVPQYGTNRTPGIH